MWIILALWMLGILASLMRHMWIGMFVALCFSWMFLMQKNVRQITKKMIIVAISFGVFILSVWVFISLLFPASTAGRISGSAIEIIVTRATSIGNIADTSISWRGSTWQSAFFSLSQNPFFGSGFGVRIPVESGEYRDFVEIRNIHNSWLALLVQMGIGGFVILGAFLVSFFFRAFRFCGETPFLSTMRVALLTILVYQGIVFFAQPYLETNLTGIFFWLTLGLMNTLFSLSGKNNFKRT